MIARARVMGLEALEPGTHGMKNETLEVIR
jgi:hypothetical protein